MNTSRDSNFNDDLHVVVTTNSVDETLELGRKLGGLLSAGQIVALVGDLGAGKTWLSKGIAFGLGVPEHEYVNSPAFDLVHEYVGRLRVYHMDFYRIDTLSSGDYLWLEEYLEGDGVCIIEWADKFIDELSNEYLRIDLHLGVIENQRQMHITAHGGQYEEVLRRVAKL